MSNTNGFTAEHKEYSCTAGAAAISPHIETTNTWGIVVP